MFTLYIVDIELMLVVGSITGKDQRECTIYALNNGYWTNDIRLSTFHGYEVMDDDDEIHRIDLPLMPEDEFQKIVI